MGLFDGLKTMVDIVKAGIESVKATDKMDAIVERLKNEYSQILSEDEKALLEKFTDLKKKYDETDDTDEANAMIDDVEKAETEFLLAVIRNPELPEELVSEIKAAMEAYMKANDAPMEKLEKRFMAMAKTDEEKEFVRKMMEEAREE